MSLPSSDDQHAASNTTNNNTTPNNAASNDDDRDDLTRRLSALRAPASTPAPTGIAIPQDDGQGDKALEARFRRLFLRQPPQPDSSTLTPKDAAAVSDEQVSSFIASVQNEREQQPTGTRQTDEGEIEALLAEASRIAVFGKEHNYDEDVDWGDGDWDGDWDSGGGGGGGVPEWLREAAHEQAQHEEEAEVLLIARDEVEFERRHAPALHSHCGSDRASEDPGDERPPEEQDEIAALERRLNALGGAAVGLSGRGGGEEGGEGGGLQLPSAPKAIPGMPAKKGDGAGVSEVDTWCCLFPHRYHHHLLLLPLHHYHHHHHRRHDVGSRDRHLQRGRRIHVFGLRRRHLLQRVSARGYLDHPLYASGQQLIGSYCTAHTGPDAGYEERRHKWTKYIRPKKILSAA